MDLANVTLPFLLPDTCLNKSINVNRREDVRVYRECIRSALPSLKSSRLPCVRSPTTNSQLSGSASTRFKVETGERSMPIIRVFGNFKATLIAQVPVL